MGKKDLEEFKKGWEEMFLGLEGRVKGLERRAMENAKKKSNADALSVDESYAARLYATKLMNEASNNRRIVEKLANAFCDVPMERWPLGFGSDFKTERDTHLMESFILTLFDYVSKSKVVIVIQDE